MLSLLCDLLARGANLLFELLLFTQLLAHALGLFLLFLFPNLIFMRQPQFIELEIQVLLGETYSHDTAEVIASLK